MKGNVQFCQGALAADLSSYHQALQARLLWYFAEMKFRLCLLSAFVVTGIQIAYLARAQTPVPETIDASALDGSDLRKEMTDRESKFLKLSMEEQLQLRAAQLKAAEDPELKAALEKRKQVLEEFRLVFRASLIKADPKIGPILEKIALGASPGY